MTTTHTQPAGCDLDSLAQRLRAQCSAPFGPEGFSLLCEAADVMRNLARAAQAPTGLQDEQGLADEGLDYLLQYIPVPAARVAAQCKVAELRAAQAPQGDTRQGAPSDRQNMTHAEMLALCKANPALAPGLPLAAHTCTPADERIDYQKKALDYLSDILDAKEIMFAAGIPQGGFAEMFQAFSARAAQGAGNAPILAPCEGGPILPDSCSDCRREGGLCELIATHPAPVSAAATPDETCQRCGGHEVIYVDSTQQPCPTCQDLSDYDEISPTDTGSAPVSIAAAPEAPADNAEARKDARVASAVAFASANQHPAPEAPATEQQGDLVGNLKLALQRVKSSSLLVEARQFADVGLALIDVQGKATTASASSERPITNAEEFFAEARRLGCKLPDDLRAFLASAPSRAADGQQGASGECATCGGSQSASDPKGWQFERVPCPDCTPADGQQGASRAAPGELRSLLQEFVDDHTKPAGMTLEAALSTDKLGEFLVGVESREKEMVQRACAALALPAQGAVAASTDEPDWRGFLEMWAHDGALQTFSSRERFRKEATALARTPLPAQADGQAVDDALGEVDALASDALIPRRTLAEMRMRLKQIIVEVRAAQSRAQSDTTGEHK